MSDTEKPIIFPETVASVLQGLGYRGKINLDGDLPIVESACDGLSFYVNLLSPLDDDPAKGFETFQFETGVNLRRDVQTSRLLHLCNRFNATYRFAKVIVAGNHDRHVAMTVDIRVGSRDPAWFEYQAELFTRFIDKFVNEIIKSDEFRGDGCSELHNTALEFLVGAQRNPETAIGLYRRASELGYAGSQNNLGDQYERGENVTQSYPFAIYWYTRAAERGEPCAYLSLATRLAEAAVDRDMLIEAAKFSILAIEHLPEGYNKSLAETCLISLKERLAIDDISLADQQAKAWRPLYQEVRIISDSPQGAEQPEKKPLLLN